MWSIFTLLVLSTHLVMGWVSGGDRSVATVLQNNKFTVTRDTTSKPLRIVFDTYDSAYSASNSVSFSSYPDIDKMIKSVQTFFKNSLSVKRVLSEIEVAQMDCGNGITVNNRLYPGADVVIILRGSSAASTTTGFSQVCVLDGNDANAPLVGVVTINKALFDAEPDYLRRWTFLAHLTVHVLGFSEALYPFWHGTSGKLGVSNIMTTITVRGLSKKAIITPLALNAARTTFNHPTMAGIELEENLAVGDRNEHLDARIFFNDVSCARSHAELIISSVTLSLLQDSGWYVVGCSGTNPIIGASSGCSFVEQGCINSGRTSNHGNLWCGAAKTNICDAFNLNKANCGPVNNLNPTIPLLAQQYFGNSATGGIDRFTDYCPYAIPDVNGNCRLPRATPPAGETFGVTSRCFEHTLELGVTGRYLSGVAGCFEVKCLIDGSYEVTVRGKTSKITCPAAGGFVVAALDISPSGWFKCAPSSVICGSVPCVNACNGQGSCVSGTCSCFPGFSGASCDVPCSDFCITCSNGPCTQCEAGLYVNTATGRCVKCQIGCSSCTSATSCNPPDLGYEVIGDVPTPICSPNCKTCVTPGTCDVPSDGYCFEKVTNVVKTCCSGCKKCAASDCCNCEQCMDGYMKTTINTCTKSCVANCLTCKSTTECLDCKVGFNLTPDGRCLRCPDGCTDCLNKCSLDSCASTSEGLVTGCLTQSICDNLCYECALVQCTACNSGFRMNNANKLCERICPLNCKICDTKVSPPTCTICNAGFFLNNLNSPPTCDPCETSCLYCSYISSTTTSCSMCRSGFFLRSQSKNGVTENDCVNCETGCYSCKSELSCEGCVARFYIQNYHCYRCEYGCKICTGQFTCTQADPGFFVQDDGRVVRCHKSCGNCDADFICNTCMVGFFFFECSSENCLCRDCGDFCAQCSSPDECIFCRSGYFLDFNKRCTRCDFLCSSCEMAGKCLSCRWGYYLKPDKTCGQCDVGCQCCVDFEHCKLCLAGYYPDEYFCNPCPFKCAFCWSPSQCYSCLTGWWLDKLKYPVPTCVSCPTTCVRCNSLTDCVLCKRTYFALQGICTKCGSNCAFCTSESTCTICELGYFLDADSTCKPCQGGCFDCCDAYTCMKAKSGWWLDYLPSLYTDLRKKGAIGSGISADKLGGYVSVPCVSKCVSCFKIDDCGACARGYYLADDKTCPICVSPCSQCRSAVDCILCVPKFYLKGSSCLPCADNCNACTETQCTAPKSGFYRDPANPFNVLPCQAPCNACVGTGLNDCINCRTGFGPRLETEIRVSAIVFSYICESCGTGCRVCNPHGKCIVALDPYYLNPDATVSLCPSTCTRCSLVQGVVTCSACLTKFGVENGQCIQCQDLNCLRCSPSNKCLVCAGTFFINNEFGCTKCIAPCNTCNSEFNCLSCLAPNYLPDPKVPSPCQRCITNCLRCTTGDSCAQCASRMYFQSATKSCQPCPANCTACRETTDIDSTIKVQCTACASRCAVEGFLCQPCVSPFCTSCRPINVCAACQWGYFIDNDKSCTKCTSPCATCTLEKCLTCVGGQYLNPNLPGTCSPCLTNCYRCLSNMDCSLVRGGFYLTAAGTPQANIVQCPIACITCAEVIVEGYSYVNCITCRSTYTLTLSNVNNVSKCCMLGCADCGNDNRNTCPLCSEGYLLTTAKTCAEKKPV